MDFSRQHIVSSAEGSLRRLRTEFLDILLLHIPDALVEPEEVAQAFDELQGSGKVRYFGVSNHTAGQIELLKKYVRQPLVANQVHLGLAHSYLIADGIEANRDESTRITRGYAGAAGTIDYCRLHDIQVQAYAPLRGGSIVEPPHLLNPPADAPLEVKQAAQVLRDLADKKETTTSAVALAWLLRHPASIVPIIGASSPEHVIENCAANRVTLSREEWYNLWVSAAGIPSVQLLGLAPKRPS
jgi:predicted oxidoreductase